MSDGYLQSGEGTQTGASTSTATVTGVTAGSAIIVFLQDGSSSSLPATFTVSDSQQGSYSAKSPDIGDNINAVWLRAFVLQNANAGTHNITGTSSGGNAFLTWIEVSADTAAAFSGANGADVASPGTGTDALSSGSVTITAAATLLCFSNDTNSTSSSDAPAAGTGFTSRLANANTAVGAWRIATIAASSNRAATATAIQGGDRFLTLGIAILNGAAGAPTINTQPTNQRGYVGATATFSITATTSGGSLSYQWKANGSNVGTNSSSYTTAAGTLSDNGTIITCVVTDSNGSTTSANAFWFVDPVSTVAWIQA